MKLASSVFMFLLCFKKSRTSKLQMLLWCQALACNAATDLSRMIDCLVLFDECIFVVGVKFLYHVRRCHPRLQAQGFLNSQ